MNPSSHTHLKRLYDKLSSKVGTLSYGSVALTLAKKRRRARHELLYAGAVHRIPPTILEDLISRGLVVTTEHGVIITGKGIVEHEFAEDIISQENISKWFDTEIFDFMTKEDKITDRGRVILMSLIALRAFSQDQPISLKVDDRIKDEIQKVIDKTVEVLITYGGMDRAVLTGLYGKNQESTEHPISRLIRHSDSLPVITHHIFRAPGDQIYFLDVAGPKGLDQSKLRQLFTIIFPDGLAYGNATSILNDLNDIAINHLYTIYSPEPNTFMSHTTDSIMREILLTL